MIATTKYVKISVLALMLSVSCASKKSEEPITRNSSASNCTDYFIVSKDLEPEARIRSILGSYLYKSLVGVYDCELLANRSDLDKLFLKESFKKAILYFYLDSASLSLNHYESKSRWLESRERLLTDCANEKTLYELTDMLLSHNIDDGLTVIWKGLDVSKLHNLDEYIEYIKSHRKDFLVADAIIVFHNSKLYSRRDSLLSYLKTRPAFNERYSKVVNLTDEHMVISRDTYVEEMYGGY